MPESTPTPAQTPPPQPPYYQDDEITLRELILKVQEYYSEVRNNWKLLLWFVIPITAVMLVRAWVEPVKYPAKLTFMVNEDEGGSSAIAGILGQFGLGGGGGGKYNMDKIVELARSRRIIQEALFDSVNIDNKVDLLANHLIRQFELQKTWKRDTTGLKGFLFANGDYQRFSKTENKALKAIYGRVVGDPDNDVEGIFSISYGEETGIFTMKVEGRSEAFSIALAEKNYEELSRFYIDKTTEKQKQTYEIARAKADSLKALLDSKQYQLLHFDDTQKGLVLRAAEATKLQLQRDLQVYALAYGEALKNVEFADFALKNATPFFQVIDWPIGPIRGVGKSKLKAIVLGFLLGLIIGITYLVIKRLVRSALEDSTMVKTNN